MSDVDDYRRTRLAGTAVAFLLGIVAGVLLVSAVAALLTATGPPR